MFRDLKPYDEYRPIPGLPLPVPAAWSVRPMRSLIESRSERGRGDLPLLTVARERGVFVRSKDDANHNAIPEDLSNYKVARAGDLVINKMKAWQGSLGLAPTDGIVSPAYFVYDFKIDEREYGQALLRSRAYVSLMGAASDGVRVGQWDLAIPRFRAIPVLVPSRAEQAAIVKYLGHAHARIDRAIAAKRKLVALLEEQKRAIINQAVTRGIDPTVPMKDSGIPWLGKIPARWETVPLKRIGRYKSGAGFPVSFQGKMEGDIPFAKVSDMNRAGNEEWIHAAESTVTRSEARELSAFVFPRNTIVFPKVGGALLTNKRRRLARPACVDNNVMGAILDETALNPDFSFLMMIVLDLGKLAKPGPVPAIGEGDVREIRVAVPPLPEQGMIVDHVQSATRAVDEARSRITSEVDLLREFRTRLTSDVVTGQLDVREIAALLPDFVEQAAVDADSGEDESFDELDEVLEEAEG